MSVTLPQFANHEAYLDQIEKITQSQVLRKAESLCRLLRYLANHSLAHPGAALKEYQIATEVFGRPRNFDPQSDSAVRVQAGRLRVKLLDYYAHEGATDPVVVEMPTGSYALHFHERELSAPASVPPRAKLAPTLKFDRRRKNSRGWILAVVGLSSALAACLAVVGTMAVTLHSAKSAKRGDFTAGPSLRTLWSQFDAGPEAPWVIFSNGAFVGRPETGMRYLDPAHDSRDLILDHYTGVGEVLAVHDLDEIFSQFHHPIRVKRGSLFSLDDAKDNDLIFVGSPAENLALLDLPGTREFVFKRVDSGPHRRDLGIVNAHPEQGQSEMFYPTNSAQPLVEDYAIVALVPGLNPARHVMILAGTTTIGTQAAVEYVCAQDSVEELLRKLAVQAGGEVKPFEALLRVKVTRGVPVGVQLVAVRKRK
jgi:hypothetical protein